MALTTDKLSQGQLQKLSPMMKQYLKIKAEHPNCILLFRLGDFYEMFFDDAILVSKELNLTLTGRDCGLEERAPMCGVPHHAHTQYLNALIKRGYHVAICEQTTDPNASSGLVEREVLRVVTPGTVIDEEVLDEKSNNFIAALYSHKDGLGLAYSDISVGSFYIMEFVGENAFTSLNNELKRIKPSEIITQENVFNSNKLFSSIKGAYYSHSFSDREFETKNSTNAVLSHFGASSLAALGAENFKLAVCAGGALISYFLQTQKNALQHINKLTVLHNDEFMHIDDFTVSNLELLSPINPNASKNSTLLGSIDNTGTPMGSRMLKQWITRPLIDLQMINERLNAVQEIFENEIRADKLIQVLRGICDIERLCARLTYGTFNPKNCVSIVSALEKIDVLKLILADFNTKKLSRISDELDSLPELLALLSTAISEDPPTNVKDGGAIKEGFDSQLDEYREISLNSKCFLAELEEAERENTGIKTLRIGYNRVFGYYFEVSKSYIKNVPDRFIRKQTLANSERYYTTELKQLEEKALNAEELSIAREIELFNGIYEYLNQLLDRLKNNAELIAELDCYVSFARAARKHNYVKPIMNSSGILNLDACRHPVVERTISERFNPNDIKMDMDENRVLIITGPNMAGKSTYMRQTALAVLMAHIGCFVPAQSAEICVVDRIFTRVGASDNLSSGQSTFMVEMSEMACILNTATKNSLLILDEIGRGTATYDGLSIAWAVLEHIAKNTGAKTMFATHYHELTVLENEYSCVKNLSVSVKELGDNIGFLHKIVKGGADRSFGIQVGALAGLPDSVVTRAKHILKDLEMNAPNHKSSKVETSEQSVAVDEIYSQLSRIDPDELSPKEALNLIFHLHKLTKVKKGN